MAIETNSCLIHALAFISELLLGFYTASTVIFHLANLTAPLYPLRTRGQFIGSLIITIIVGVVGIVAINLLVLELARLLQPFI